MRALLYQNKILTLEQNYPKPSLESGEALIRVLQTGICNTDMEITRGYLAFQGFWDASLAKLTLRAGTICQPIAPIAYRLPFSSGMERSLNT